MSLIEIRRPLLDGGIRSVNFFNGRLLSGEDLSTEQEANREAQQRLGRAIGQGIITGLEVTMPPPGETDGYTPPSPTVAVKRGMAINAFGQTLMLSDDIHVALTDITTAALDNGQDLYLLTMATAAAQEGYAPTSSFAPVQVGASAVYTNRYRVDAVQFHLFPLALDSNMVKSIPHMRNRLAYACFGWSNEGPRQQQSMPDEFGPFTQNEGLLEGFAYNLTDHIPLAILYWPDEAQSRFIDTWPVRRRLVQPAFTEYWQEAIGNGRLAVAEAMFLQFQSQIADIQHRAKRAHADAPATPAPLAEVRAEEHLSFLPAAGYLPVDKHSFSWKNFLGPLAPSDAIFVDRALLRLLLHNSFYESPIKVGPYADGTPAHEQPITVYQDASQPDFVLFARSTTGRINITVDGYQPSEVCVSVGIGQQARLTIPLQQNPGTSAKRSLFVDAENIHRPGLHKVRFSLVQQPGKRLPSVSTTMIQIDPPPENVLDWLKSWQQWLNERYPNQGIDYALPALYMNDQYKPPNEHYAPGEPAAYAVFGEVAFPLLVNISYYTMPLSVPLDAGGLPGLTNDVIGALASVGIFTIEQVAGAWSRLIANATQESTMYGTSMIIDALHTLQQIVAKRLYYEGIAVGIGNSHKPVAEILEQMALRDDVALANADTDELGANVKSVGFASRLIAQAQKAVPSEHWSLASLGINSEQLPVLQRLGINSKGELVQRARTEEGRKQLEGALLLNEQAIHELHVKAFGQMTASSYALARIKDLILLPNANAEVTTKLAASQIFTANQVAKLERKELMRLTGLHADAAEVLQKAATEAGKEGLEIVHLASITREVADNLNKVLHVKTIADVFTKSEDEVAEALKPHFAERAAHFVKAFFDGIAGSKR